MKKFTVSGEVRYGFQVEVSAPNAKEAARIVREDKDVGELLEEAQQNDVEIHYVASVASRQVLRK